MMYKLTLPIQSRCNELAAGYYGALPAFQLYTKTTLHTISTDTFKQYFWKKTLVCS